MSKPFATLSKDYWDFMMERFPTSATFLGDDRFNDCLEELGPKARSWAQRKLFSFQKALQKIKLEDLSSRERIFYQTLALQIQNDLEGFSYSRWQWNLDHLSGVHMYMIQLLEYHPLKTPKNYEDLLERYRQIPRLFDQHMADLKEGMKEGRTAPSVAYDHALRQLDQLSHMTVKEFPLMKPGWRFPKTISKRLQAKFQEKFAEVVQKKVLPAYGKFFQFLKTDYANQARSVVGISAIPQGQKNYDYLARVFTTTDLTPEALHLIGKEELQKNIDELLQIAREVGHTGDLKSFQEKIKADPENHFKSAEELVAHHRASLARMKKMLPKYFGKCPKSALEVKEIDPFKAQSSMAAYYFGPTSDGKRPAIFWMNTLKPTEWSKYSMETLAFHEGIPGHHLQVSLAIEQKDLPKFQRHGRFIAYIEGWAHYAERLSDEMGAYSGPLDRVGMLMDQAWRAIRLVVDTGVHSMGWTRAQALEFMAQTRTAPEMEMNNEIDRYIIWPGQALAYKVGQRAFSELRTFARQKLGSRFDIRKFHDTVLLSGPLPLTILKQIVEQWVGQELEKKKA
ncbi:MAG: DUF885 domain-containing protein [Deltaproteobacteria bacterium]|nr:DUF885 domain-containing protein [Deltaproteobacteria bacterium]